MEDPLHTTLSRREREIMDIVYQLGEAGVAEVASRMRDDPGYDSVRVTLGILEKKGHVTHRQDGRRYLYSPTVPHQAAGPLIEPPLSEPCARGTMPAATAAAAPPEEPLVE